MRSRALFLLSLISVTSALANEYDRSVRVDWKPIEGAVSYDVEYFDGETCQKKMGSEVVKQPFWRRKLGAGHYCVRVRGVGLGDKPGEWSPAQKIAVRPKSPLKFAQEGRRVEWDPVPGADDYQVTVKDQAGRTLLKRNLRGSEFRLPKRIIESRAAKKGLQVAVQTRMKGLRPSKAKYHSVSGKKAVAPPTQAQTQAQKIREVFKRGEERKLPEQPEFEVMAPEEAEERFTISGEKPVAPTRAEWKKAKTKREVATLRQRTIASSRVQLLEEVSRMHPSDLRASLGLGGAQYLYYGGGIDNAGPPADSDGFGLQVSVDAVYNQERPWGATFEFRQLQVSGAYDEGSAFTRFALYLDRHIPLDSLWNTFWSFSIGAEYSQHPIFSQSNADGGSGVVPMTLNAAALGPSAKINYKWKINPKWMMEGEVAFRWIPNQDAFESIEDATFSGTGGNVRLGAVRRFSRTFEAGAGYQLGASKIENNNKEMVSRIVEHQFYLKGTYRMSPSESRSPGAISVSREDHLHTWETRLSLPLGIRPIHLVPHESQLSQESTTPVGIDVELRKRFGVNSHWSLALRGGGEILSARGKTITGTRAYLLGGYELNILRQKNLTALFEVGFGGRTVSGVSLNDFQKTFAANEVVADSRIFKSWNRRWVSELGIKFSVPIAVGVGTGTEKTGTNLAWKVKFGGGYRLSRKTTLWFGYHYEQLRYAVNQVGATGSSGIDSIDFGENGLDLGVSFGW